MCGRVPMCPLDSVYMLNQPSGQKGNNDKTSNKAELISQERKKKQQSKTKKKPSPYSKASKTSNSFAFMKIYFTLKEVYYYYH